MYATFRDPRMQQGFSALSRVFGAPDASTAIKADLMAHQRDQLVAQTQLAQAQTTEQARYNSQSSALANILSDPNWQQDEHKRAAVISAMSGTEKGLAQMPNLVGAGVYQDPNFLDRETLSTVLVGNGIQSWGGTPQGADELAQHAQERQDSVNAQRIQTAQQRVAGRPLDIKPKTAHEFGQLLDLQINSLYPDTQMDPRTRQAILNRGLELYQQTRNAEGSMQQAIEELQISRQEFASGNGALRFMGGRDAVVSGPARTATRKNPDGSETVVILNPITNEWVPAEQVPTEQGAPQ